MNSFVHFLIRAFSAAALFPVIASAVAYSDPLGIIRLDLQGGGQLNVFSNPFLPQAVFQTQVTAISGTDVTVASAVDPALGSDHYLEIATGAGAGSMSDILSVAGSVLGTADDLSSILSVGDSIVVRAIPTLESVFGSDNKFGFKARTPSSDPNDWDLLYLFNPQDQTLVVAYYADFPPSFQGWVEPVGGSPVNPKIYPEAALLALIKGAEVNVTMVGEVTKTAPSVAVFPGLNFATVFNPLSGVTGVDPGRVLTLGTSGLYTGDPATGIIARDDIVRHDLVLLPSESVEGAFDTYFYFAGTTNAWFNAVSFAPSNDRVIETGTAVIVMRYETGASEFGWPQPNLHLAAP